MVANVQLEAGVYGQRAVVTSTWSDDMLAGLLHLGIAELELNAGKGWHGNDLTFLTKLPHLHALSVLDLTIPSVEPIHCLRELRALEVVTYCNTPIRFQKFPFLEDCSLEWRAGAETLFSSTELRRLFVNRYTGKETTPFGRLLKLERLQILNAPIADLRGLIPLTKLLSLRLANLRNLQTLAGIEHLSNLEVLEIHTCRAVRSIDEVGSLAKLRELHLNNDGDIETLHPLDRLSGLRSLTFYESTNIVDGDLTPLLRQKNLSRLSFENRRHYSHRREDFPAYAGQQ